MKKLLVGAVAAVTLACGGGPKDGADDFRNGVPRADDVAVKLPARSTQPLTGEGVRRDGLEGQQADFYTLTRGATLIVNGGTAAVLNLIEEITEYPATTVSEDVAVWGPHTEPLAKNTWKLTVTRTAPDTYSYALQGKGKTEADSAFRVVLSGTHHTLGAKVGDGAFLLDWDQAVTLPENDGKVGTVTVTYARPSLASTTQIDAAFHQVRDTESGQLVDADYRYVATPAQGGTFEFALLKNSVAGPGLELSKVKSRWLESGAGRADAQISQGDLTGPATVSECWDSNFLSRHLAPSFAPGASYGDPATCVFTTAEYPSF